MTKTIRVATAALFAIASASASFAGDAASGNSQTAATTSVSSQGATGADQRSTSSTDRFMYIARGSDQGEGRRGGNPDSQALCGYAGQAMNVYFFDC